jgi:hypothetical protein
VVAFCHPNDDITAHMIRKRRGIFGSFCTILPDLLFEVQGLIFLLLLSNYFGNLIRVSDGLVNE